MSKATLQSLLDFLFGMLSPSDMRWVAQQLVDQADADDLEPYTIEELHRMVAESEREIAAGLCQDSEDVFRELEEEFAKEEEPQYAEAV